MTEYTASIALTDRLIRKKGRAITLRRSITTPGEKPYDPPVVTSEDYETTGVFLFGVKENRSGEIIEQENETVMVPAFDLPILPATDDVVIDGGVQRVILSVRATKPGDEAIFYRIELKQ